MNKLVEGRANLEASYESIKSKLERTQLQLDGAQTKNSELERLNDELKRTNTELTRQLEKWQSLETKEGEAADTERKQRISLEMELREVKDASEKMVEKAVAELEKEKGRVEKMKITVREWEVRIPLFLYYEKNLALKEHRKHTRTLKMMPGILKSNS